MRVQFRGGRGVFVSLGAIGQSLLAVTAYGQSSYDGHARIFRCAWGEKDALSAGRGSVALQCRPMLWRISATLRGMRSLRKFAPREQ
ncbi:hypothetical protein [Steroidobacter gossypii]|uniref:hypothetical protein n=1 Tax=Steroidobacter gossypii TaxID=2805490 RepID=UPI001C3FF06A|nr:hypothetical protein [Steroidobacter gossypii]